MSSVSTAMEEFMKHRIQLDKAMKEDDQHRIKDLLEILSNTIISKQLLQETNIGKLIGRLRTHGNESISSSAKSLVIKWKEAIIESASSSSPRPFSPVPSLSDKATKNSPTSSTKKDLKSSSEKISNGAKKLSASGGSSADHKSQSMKDPKRAKIADALATAFSAEVGASNDSSSLDPSALAQEVEEALYKDFFHVDPSSKKYTLRARSIIFNIKQNADLRSQLLQGHIPPATLVSMEAHEMASPALKEWRQAQEDFQKIANQAGQPLQVETAAFTCSRCKQSRTNYFQLQTRSADEPMTTFIACLNCGKRWKQ